VQALQTNNTLTTIDLTNNTGVTDASIDAIGELIGPRGKVTVSTCFGLCSKRTISAVHTVTLQGTAVSAGKQRWLAAQVTLRQLSSKRDRPTRMPTRIIWRCEPMAASDLENSTADSNVFVTDVEVEALTKSLRSNSSITSIDLSGNRGVTDRSVQPLMAILPRCAVRTLHVSGTGVTAATAHKIDHRMLEMMPWSPCWARCCWPCGGSESKLRSCLRGSESKLRSCLRKTQTSADNACTKACWCKYTKPIQYLLAVPFAVLAIPFLPFVGLYFAQQYLARKWRERPVAPELTRVAANSTAMRKLYWGENAKTDADVDSLVQALQTNNTLTTIDLTNNTGVTDASIDAIGELIGPRGKVTVSTCFGLCSKRTISAVHTVTLQGTAVSAGKQRWLAAQVTLRQLSSKRDPSSTIDWASSGITDAQVAALVGILEPSSACGCFTKSNSRITSINLSGNKDVTDKSVTELLGVLPRCAVRSISVSGCNLKDTLATRRELDVAMVVAHGTANLEEDSSYEDSFIIQWCNQQIGDTDVQRLLKALRDRANDHSISRIDLSGNKLVTEAMVQRLKQYVADIDSTGTNIRNDSGNFDDPDLIVQTL